MDTKSIPLSPPACNGQSSPLADNRIVNRLFWIVSIAVGFIATGSFTLSFMALYALATANGIPALLGWIWPLIVDLSMVIYTATVLVAQLQHRTARLPIALTVFYAIVTVVGNILHASPTPLGWFVAALPPLSLILGAEVLRVMARHNIEQQAILVTLAELSTRRDTLTTELDTLTTKLETLARQLTARRAELDNLNRTNAGMGASSPAFVAGDLTALALANDIKQSKLAERRTAVLSLVNEGLSPTEISEHLAVSLRTIKRDITALNGKVRAQ